MRLNDLSENQLGQIDDFVNECVSEKLFPDRVNAVRVICELLYKDKLTMDDIGSIKAIKKVLGVDESGKPIIDGGLF